MLDQLTVIIPLETAIRTLKYGNRIMKHFAFRFTNTRREIEIERVREREKEGKRDRQSERRIGRQIERKEMESEKKREYIAIYFTRNR